MNFLFFVIADRKKIEHGKVTTTADEVCILENEVGQTFGILILTDYFIIFSICVPNLVIEVI